MKRPLAAMGVGGLHEFRLYKQWLRSDMKEFALDTFLMRSTRESGLFSHSCLMTVAHDFFSGKDESYREVVVALDIALAQQQFRASLQ
ncbi:MAG: hypothetical protein HY348_06510 [Nitrospira defluvii]|nr:hypothetical protein [Nitrospira defluvii]